MFAQLRSFNFYVIFCLDLVLFSAALFSAYLVRFEFILDRADIAQILSLLPLVLVVKATGFFFMGLYKGMFRYKGIADLWKLCKATALSSLVLITFMLIVHRFQGYSRGVFLIDGVLAFLFTGGLRVFIRFIFKEYMNTGTDSGFYLFKNKKELTPVLIYGAGSAGEKLYRELTDNPKLCYHVVGFVDDDKNKQGRSVHGVPVLGGIKVLDDIKEKHKVKEVLIAIPSSTGR